MSPATDTRSFPPLLRAAAPGGDVFELRGWEPDGFWAYRHVWSGDSRVVVVEYLCPDGRLLRFPLLDGRPPEVMFPTPGAVLDAVAAFNPVSEPPEDW